MRVLDAEALSSEFIAAEVAACVREGGVVVLPTDTVYGIFCDPASDAAIERIYALKKRPRSKALGLYVDDVDAFLAIAGRSSAVTDLAAAFLPGPLTVVVARPAGVSPAISAGLATVGLRVADHALLRTVLRATGPLAGTSANLSGRPSFAGGAADATELPDADLFVDDGVSPLGTESTVIDVSQTQARMVREGAIHVALLEKVLGIELR